MAMHWTFDLLHLQHNVGKKLLQEAQTRLFSKAKADEPIEDVAGGLR
ncbi:MAG: hypothetical protein ABI980_13450 [Nitrospirota bacterium]